MLAALRALGATFVATQSSNPRALRVADLGALARLRFPYVEAVADPVEAAVCGRELAGETAGLLVTGSLYLLADLYAATASPSAAEAYHEAVR